MTLQLWTARLGSYRGKDALDISRKTGSAGLFLAPSWELLRPVLQARRQAQAMREMVLMGHYNADCGEADATAIEEEAWEAYVPAYRLEALASWRANRDDWIQLLSRETVSICCYCSRVDRCHRGLAAGYLVKLGAEYMGEREPVKKQATMFGEQR